MSFPCIQLQQLCSESDMLYDAQHIYLFCFFSLIRHHTDTSLFNIYTDNTSIPTVLQAWQKEKDYSIIVCTRLSTLSYNAS